jgi:DNA-binding CsgD family transcriptional regulator
VRNLSKRQREVASLCAAGLGNDQIAFQLGIGAKSVKEHLRVAMRKTGLSSRLELALWWREQPEAGQAPHFYVRRLFAISEWAGAHGVEWVDTGHIALQDTRPPHTVTVYVDRMAAQAAYPGCRLVVGYDEGEE